MNPLLANNLEKIKIYCRQYDVEKLYAFGSATKQRCPIFNLKKLRKFALKAPESLSKKHLCVSGYVTNG